MAPAPKHWAGAAAARTAGLATDLVGQVAERSSDWPERHGALAQADALRQRAAAQRGEVSEAYAELLGALDRAVASGSSSSPSSPELGRQLAAAADLLLAIAETACDAGELALEAARAGDTVVRADAACAAVLAESAAAVATALVEVNLAVADDDERVTRARGLRCAAATSRASALDLLR